MFLPKRINVKRKAAWFGDGDLGSDKQPNDMSPTDAQVGCLWAHAARIFACLQSLVRCCLQTEGLAVSLATRDQEAAVDCLP